MKHMDILQALPAEIQPKAESVVRDVISCVNSHCIGMHVDHVKGILPAIAAWVEDEIASIDKFKKAEEDAQAAAAAAQEVQASGMKVIPVEMSATVTGKARLKG